MQSLGFNAVGWGARVLLEHISEVLIKIQSTVVNLTKQLTLWDNHFENSWQQLVV